MPSVEKRAEVLGSLEVIHKKLVGITEDCANLEIRKSPAAKSRVVTSFNEIRAILDEIEKSV